MQAKKINMKQLFYSLLVLGIISCSNPNKNEETTTTSNVPVDTGLSDQRMASTPEELIKALGEVSFKTPEEYESVIEKESNAAIGEFDVGYIHQSVNEATDPNNDIKASDIDEYLDKLTDFAIQSKNDGELIWGRVQGTKYERNATLWVGEKFREFGIDDIRIDTVPARRPLWYLSELELTITKAPTFTKGETYKFSNALTGYQSATTPKGGVEAEVIYVGEGTPAELQGRDLKDKIVLLRSRGLPGGLFHSARTAYSRIVIGDYGMPKGIIVWPDIPNATQVATRVGSIGGGENLGLALPWTTINNNDGYYLRKLLDRATPKDPVRMRLNVQGEEQGPDKRHSLNLYGVLPGQSGKYILHLAHVDGFLYAQHCNGGGVALTMALAKHLAKIPANKRNHGHIFLMVGDHENPGVGATDKFIEKNRELMENDVLMVLRPEKPGMVQEIDEGWITSKTNVATPPMLMITNRSPLLVELFQEAAQKYSVASSDFYFVDPAADETNFHPPYFDAGIITAGWTSGTRYYHTTADYENDLISPFELEKMARAHAYIVSQLENYTKADIEKGAVPYTAEKSIYQSDLLKLMLGNH